MKILNQHETGVQEELCTFTKSMCNFESILACVFYKYQKRFPTKKEMINFLSDALSDLESVKLDSDAFVNDSAVLIKKILKVNMHETKRLKGVELRNAKNLGVCVACFKKGESYHFNVINFSDYYSFTILYDGYKSSSIAKYGELFSVRVYE